jgi:hypothetical protein
MQLWLASVHALVTGHQYFSQADQHTKWICLSTYLKERLSLPHALLPIPNIILECLDVLEALDILLNAFQRVGANGEY